MKWECAIDTSFCENLMHINLRDFSISFILEERRRHFLYNNNIVIKKTVVKA